jgi:flagellin-like hook-associated protein FlgL
LANDAAVAAITGQLTITGTAGAATLDFDVIATEADLAAAIGAASTASGTTIAFTVGGGSTLDVTAAAGESFTISGTHAGLGGTLANGTINPTAGTPVNNVDRAALETEFNNLLIQIDQLASDASFNGVNLLSGDNLSVIFNEDGTSKLDINGVTFNSAGLAINAATTDAFQTNTGVNASLAELDAAIGTLRQQASTFGSNLSVVEIRQDFTKNLINTLETGAANLTLADTNEEGANLLALQTRQQLSTIALSLATQADQNVLRLF